MTLTMCVASLPRLRPHHSSPPNHSLYVFVVVVIVIVLGGVLCVSGVHKLINMYDQLTWTESPHSQNDQNGSPFFHHHHKYHLVIMQTYSEIISCIINFTIYLSSDKHMVTLMIALPSPYSLIRTRQCYHQYQMIWSVLLCWNDLEHSMRTKVHSPHQHPKQCSAIDKMLAIDPDWQILQHLCRLDSSWQVI